MKKIIAIMLIGCLFTAQPYCAAESQYSSEKANEPVSVTGRSPKEIKEDINQISRDMKKEQNKKDKNTLMNKLREKWGQLNEAIARKLGKPIYNALKRTQEKDKK
jgi:hypothetical protein